MLRSKRSRALRSDLSNFAKALAQAAHQIKVAVAGAVGVGVGLPIGSDCQTETVLDFPNRGRHRDALPGLAPSGTEVIAQNLVSFGVGEIQIPGVFGPANRNLAGIKPDFSLRRGSRTGGINQPTQLIRYRENFPAAG